MTEEQRRQKEVPRIGKRRERRQRQERPKKIRQRSSNCIKTGIETNRRKERKRKETLRRLRKRRNTRRKVRRRRKCFS